MMQTAKPLERGEHELSTGLVGYSRENSIEEDYSMKNSPLPGIDVMYRTGLFKNADVGVSFAPSATVGHLRADMKYNFYRSSNENTFVSSLLSIEADNLRYISYGFKDDLFVASGLGFIASFNHQIFFQPFIYQKLTFGLNDLGVFNQYQIDTPPEEFVNYSHKMYYIGGAGFRYQFKNNPRLQLLFDVSYSALRRTLYYNYEGFSGDNEVMKLSKSIQRYINYQCTFGISFRLGNQIPTLREDSSTNPKKNSPLPPNKLNRFKISTNLIRPFMEFHALPRNNGWFFKSRFLSSSRDISIEPEYQFSKNFAVAAPLYIGLTKMDKNVENHELYTNWSYVDSNSIPTLKNPSPYYFRRLDLIGQLGLQGKWYPFGREIQYSSKIYPFVSVGTHFALYDIYSFDFGQTWSSTSIAELGEYYYNDSKNYDIPAIEIRSHRTGVFRGEFLTGIEFMFNKRIGLIYSIGYSTQRLYFSNATDRIYTRMEGDEYKLIEEVGFPKNRGSNNDIGGFFINRLKLTYSFN